MKSVIYIESEKLVVVLQKINAIVHNYPCSPLLKIFKHKKTTIKMMDAQVQKL
jgi:hypothetical protein